MLAFREEGCARSAEWAHRATGCPLMVPTVRRSRPEKELMILPVLSQDQTDRPTPRRRFDRLYPPRRRIPTQWNAKHLAKLWDRNHSHADQKTSPSSSPPSPGPELARRPPRPVPEKGGSWGMFLVMGGTRPVPENGGSWGFLLCRPTRAVPENGGSWGGVFGHEGNTPGPGERRELGGCF